MKFLYVASLLWGGLALGDFSTLTCKKVISDEFQVKVKSNGTHFQWRSRGGERVLGLLREIIDPKVPTSLIEAYGDVFVDFTLPNDSCEFHDSVPGGFSCSFKKETKRIVNVNVKARVSAYGDKPYDKYDGELSSVEISSNSYGEPGKGYLKFPMRFGFTKGDFETETTFFFAHTWESEGFTQQPSCLLDNEYLSF